MLVLAILSVDQLATWAVKSDTGRALIRARARELLGRDIAYGGAEGTLLPPAVVVRESRAMGADEEAPARFEANSGGSSRAAVRRLDPGRATPHALDLAAARARLDLQPRPDVRVFWRPVTGTLPGAGGPGELLRGVGRSVESS